MYPGKETDGRMCLKQMSEMEGRNRIDDDDDDNDNM